MKYLIPLFFVLTFSLSGLTAFAQVKSEPTTPLRLKLRDEVDRGSYMEIVYEISMPGFVELHLFNYKKEKLYIKGKVTDRSGLDKIRFSTKPLERGKFYTYILKYKGQEHKGSFTL